MAVRPVAASLRMNSILVGVGTVCFMFWRPSRGPTSIMRTVGEARREGDVVSGRSWHCRRELQRIGLVTDLLQTQVVRGLRWNILVSMFGSRGLQRCRSARPGGDGRNGKKNLH